MLHRNRAIVKYSLALNLNCYVENLNAQVKKSKLRHVSFTSSIVESHGSNRDHACK